MTLFDAPALARRQLEIDRERTRAMPGLLAHKLDRMTPSPLAFLRGAAPLFYEVLAASPELAAGPGGEGWVVGDLHLENFGAYRPGGAKKGETRALFDLNDLDDGYVGPWRLDVLRLTTSLILGGRELGAAGPEVIALAERLLRAYVQAVFVRAPLPPAPRCVTTLIERVEGREQRDFLDDRTETVKGQRRLRRSDHYLDLAPALRAGLDAALSEYGQKITGPDAVRPEQLEVLDAAFRVAGTGSLGAVRVAALVRGKGDDGAWILDLKEQGTPSAAVLIPPPAVEPATRVEQGLRAMIASPPRMVGTTHLNGLSMFVRRLSPQEDKLDLTRLKHEVLGELVDHLAGLLGRAHLRGARQIPAEAWTDVEQSTLIDHAISLAGLHEAVYLSLCRLGRR
jgi:uncharacterized protein (DUF2252 family)